MAKSLKIDMCAGSELKDTQGETLSVEGADISELEAGRGRLNDNHGKGNFNCLGHITEAKKIFKAEDCDNERHQYYWDKMKSPYIYVAGELYNNEDHPNAKACAAIIKNVHRKDIPLKMKASVEGGVMARGIKDPTRLAQTKIHSVALTFTPANNATLVEPLGLDKSSTNWEADKQLIKSVMHLAETNVPSFRHITRHASANVIYDNLNKIQELAKTVGVEIQIREIDPETIMEKAVLNKVSSNISKINDLVKALGDKPKPIGGSAVRQAADVARKEKQGDLDRYQQNIGQLKGTPTTPTKPIDTATTPSGTVKVQSAAKVQHVNKLKSHAGKAMRDPQHLENLHSALVGGGAHPDKATAVIDSIKSHMVKTEDNMEKGDIVRAGKSLLLAGALAAGAHSFSPKKEVKTPAPEQKEKALEAKRKAHNLKVKDPDLKIGPVKGYDQTKPNAKAKYYKSKLKKALTAGYGGAGAPTDLTGGGVFQAEQIDNDGKNTKKTDSDEFDYINCDNCGHEQVYMKHQVKCRKCRKNFSLSKLESLV